MSEIRNFFATSADKNNSMDWSEIEFDAEAEYSTDLFRNLREQYKQQMYCDIDLIANDGIK